MDKGFIACWKNIQSCENLLLFAQTVNELVFDYSIPSYRLPTLNTHYLCLDALSVINDIDKHGVYEGSLKPIINELFFAIKKDILFAPPNESPIKYFVKEQNEKIVKVNNPDDLNYEQRKKIVTAININFFGESKYLNNLKTKIIDIVKSNDISKQNDLYDLTKNLIVELVNVGYDQRYINEELRHKFFNAKTTISSPEQIVTFLNLFNGVKKKFQVVLIIDDKIKTITSHIDNVKCMNVFKPKTGVIEEAHFLEKDSKQTYIAFSDVEAVDPYSAAESIFGYFNLNISLYKLSDHNYDFDIFESKCIVYDVSNYYTIITKRKGAISKGKMPPKDIINENMKMSSKLLETNITPSIPLFRAVNLHCISLKNNSEENQLLDLWAIFETILNISNKHTSDRIQQMCTFLVPILRNQYMFSLFEQLAFDIKNYNENEYKKIVNTSSSNFEQVFEVCKFTVLEEYDDARSIFISKCSDFPLLKIRMLKYYSIFKTRKSLYEYIDNHSTRVKWQIMRIYRNRNLIIHNGVKMPYSSLLIENLHSYVDDFLEFIIRSYSEGYNLESMIQDLFSKECEWVDKIHKNNVIDSEFVRDVLQI